MMDPCRLCMCKVSYYVYCVVDVKARATKRQSPLVRQKEAEVKAAKRQSPLVRQKEAEA